MHCTWHMVPVFQQLSSLAYVEYLLIGMGPTFPAWCGSQTPIPKWLGPAALAVESAARFVTCEKGRAGTSILQEACARGSVEMCSVCKDIRDRFVTAIPRKEKKRRAKEDDLLGGLEEEAEASGDEASSVSSHNDGQSSGGEEPCPVAGPNTGKAKANPHISLSTTPLKIRPARQGMPAST